MTEQEHTRWCILNLPATDAEATVFWFVTGKRWWSHYHIWWWEDYRGKNEKAPD